MLGSFAGVVVLRWPAGRTVGGRSACDGCGAVLRWWALVPVLSFVALRGRCRRCGGRIARLHLAMELGGGAIGAGAMAVAPGWAGLAGGAFGCALMALAVLDARHFWLPDRITLPLLAAGLAAGLSDMADRAIGAAAGWGSLALVGWGYARWRGRTGLGGGDAKMFAATGAWLGWRALPVLMLIACAAGLTWAVAVRARGTTRLPLGTLLALAAAPAWAVLASGQGGGL